MSATAAVSAESGGVLRLKVISFGDANVGKSCLIKRFCENKFVAKYVATIGVDYGVKPVKIKEREVRVNFFDLSGLDAYTEIRNEFYKDSSAAFLVFSMDNRESFDHLETWLKEARACGLPNVPIALVGNKSENRKVVSTEEAKKFADARSMTFSEVSASIGTEVQNMFMTLLTKAVEAPAT